MPCARGARFRACTWLGCRRRCILRGLCILRHWRGSLSNLQVVQHLLDTVYLGRVIRSRGALRVTVHTSGEGDYAFVGVNLDLSTAKRRVGVDLALHVSG